MVGVDLYVLDDALDWLLYSCFAFMCCYFDLELFSFDLCGLDLVALIWFDVYVVLFSVLLLVLFCFNTGFFNCGFVVYFVI